MGHEIIKRRARIKLRVRSKIIRQTQLPRLSVHRSNKHIYAQVIDDFVMKTLAAAHDYQILDKGITHIGKAKQVGSDLAEKMKEQNIMRVVFDRGCYPYKGRIKALAEAVREAGITI